MNTERQLELLEWAIASIKHKHLFILLDDIKDDDYTKYMREVVLDALVLDKQLDTEDLSILDKPTKHRIIRILDVAQKIVSDNPCATEELEEFKAYIEEQETL